MAFQISGSLAIDETSGTQNASSALNVFADNDVNIATLSDAAGAPEFDLLLTAVAGAGAPKAGVSVSNANAANPTGTPLLTGLGANVTNLAFTDSLSQPLDGDAAKFAAGATDFLMTADGYKIFLYSYSALVGIRTVNGSLPADLAGVDENNAVFGIKANVSGAGGVADPNGAVVFAAYLQPTDASGNVQASDLNAAGAKVWIVEYQALQHGTAGSTATDYDDARSLFDPLFVSVSNRTDFSLEGAPSGQNLFLMYGDGTPAAGETAIVVTGKHPINQSIDSSGITAGDTVNTGQGGGKTTIGSNNQMVDPNEGMYFTFVKLAADSVPGLPDDGSVPVTVPNLDQNEADLESNINFDSYLGQNEAIFRLVQLQPPKASTLLITALNNADGTEKGVNFIDGLNDGTGADIHGGDDDTLVNVTEVTITRTAKNGTITYQHTFAATGIVADLDAAGGPLTLDFTNETVKITGAIAGDLIDYKTAALHNRVLIENIGNSDAKFNSAFDIGGFSLINANTVPDPFRALTFQDDGPTAGIALGTSEVTVDETAGVTDNDVAGTTAFDPDGTGGNPATTLAALFAIANAGTDTNLPQYALSGDSVVLSTGSSGGTDGAKSTVFSLAIAGSTGNGTDSQLDTTDGKNILLFKEGDLIVGRYDTANGTVDGTDPAAFAIAIDQTGKVAVAQYVSLKHTTPGNGTTPAGSYDERIDLTGLVNAVVTVTDNDNDTATASTAIGDKINFDDDGPGMAFGNLIGTGTIDPQFGYWTRNAGTDGVVPGVTGLDINATGFTIVRPNNTTATGTATLDPLSGSPDANGNYLFSGTLSGDFDNNANTTDAPINYFLTALANGTYMLDLVEGFVSTTSIVSTIDGLTAGGPDPVQTLTPGAGLHPPAPLNDKQIVFFNVLATDSESQIESLIGGTPDLTEAQIEANPAFKPLLGTEAMNVSTSGIGVGNNNLNGNDTSSSGLDESFVANPEFDVTKVKVYIDNSVSGYTPATESLSWTLYYTDGSTSGSPVKVLAGDIIAGEKSNLPVHFDVQAAAGKTIDAIQLTMDSGTIKVPYIEFVTEIAAPANDLQLAFQAILTDGDGDTATSNFLANLFANELFGSFDFVQTGTVGADAFNIDLPDLKNTYEVNAFTVGTDKLVLLGANSYTIGSSGGNSVVDITETAGGQHTFVTVVGVAITGADIATIV